MSTYVSSIASTQVSSSPDSSMMNISSATKRLATRAVITGVGSAAFSVFYLGVPFTTATVKNAALMSGSCTLGELATRYLIPRVLHTQAKSPVNMLVESAITSAIYSQLFEPLVFNGSTVPMTTLIRNSMVTDLASQLVSDRVHDAIFEGDGY